MKKFKKFKKILKKQSSLNIEEALYALRYMINEFKEDNFYLKKTNKSYNFVMKHFPECVTVNVTDTITPKLMKACNE